MARPVAPGRDVVVAAGFFALSGAGALVYQVAWQRLLALSTGVAVHSVAIITAAFMAGLGIGSHLGGVLSSRLSPRRSLLAFVAVESTIAALALLSVPFYYDLLYRRAPWLYGGLLLSSLTHFLSLLPPTVLMGMSLPLLVRGLVRDRAGAARTIGVLYGANALGAAAGAFATPWFLMRFVGITGAVFSGACGSAAAALGAFLLARGMKLERETAAAPAVEIPEAEPPQPFARWVALYALSGFLSLSLEMAWFRVLDVAAKDAAFTFGTLLAIYLLGFGAGTLAGSGRVAAIRRPLTVFLACQVGVVLATLVTHALLVWLPSSWPLLSWLVEYGKTPYGVQIRAFSLTQFLVIYLAVPLLLFGPSTFLMGFGFPVLQRATQSDPVLSGRRVGLLQAANIAGCTLGSLVTGLLLFDAVGTSGVFRLLALAALALALLGHRAGRDLRFAPAAAALLLGVLVFPSNERLWRRFNGDPDPANSFIEEDAAGVTALTPEPERYRLSINGRYNSWLPYAWLHTIIGVVPAIVHPEPREVAVVGLGSGDTAWAVACREETRRAVVFEIASSQPRLLGRVADQPRMVRLQQFLSDPRIVIVKDDGRRRLQADGRKYDVIVADAIDTDSALSNNIYSIQFYRLVRDSLRPGGLVCVLAKTPRIAGAVRRVFPAIVQLGDELFLASPDPIALDRAAWLARARSQRMVDYFGKARVRQIAEFLQGASYGQRAAFDAEVNDDLDPKDEFVRPFGSENPASSAGLRGLTRHRWD